MLLYTSTYLLILITVLLIRVNCFFFFCYWSTAKCLFCCHCGNICILYIYTWSVIATYYYYIKFYHRPSQCDTEPLYSCHYCNKAPPLPAFTWVLLYFWLGIIVVYSSTPASHWDIVGRGSSIVEIGIGVIIDCVRPPAPAVVCERPPGSSSSVTVGCHSLQPSSISLS